MLAEENNGSATSLFEPSFALLLHSFLLVLVLVLVLVLDEEDVSTLSETFPSVKLLRLSSSNI
jgi:hypothetical protein